jgi:hypothetical protein
MGTDDIMPLVDGLRNNFGTDVAEQFSKAAEQHIQNTADALQKYRDAVDVEAQRLEGHISDEDSSIQANDMVDQDVSSMADVAAAPLGDDGGEEESLEDILGGDESNASEDPLGRAKKESHVITIGGKKVRLSEDQISALMKTNLIRRKIKALAEAKAAAELSLGPKHAVITVRGNKIRVSEAQVAALVFAKKFNKLVESKQAKTARLNESQARKLMMAKKLTETINKLTVKKTTKLIDIVEK